MHVVASGSEETMQLAGPLSSVDVAQEVFGPIAQRVSADVPRSVNRYAMGQGWGS
ncbi:hypothetical protein L1O03_00410 [Corynebacterium uropygiale]|uniref:Uncharacterized protein n=1 Tax=Corynebacterium uropygiale TaxID=1775911 RepID=A0A9X1QLW2_9CORY|nr:hypothetical protein [Corynebacterium uropygiale]MCF4005649.1 hypothetical protein [Corynebacterium uropygiale]